MKPSNILCRLFPAWFRPSWDECTIASLWDGGNAERRRMNTLFEAITPAVRTRTIFNSTQIPGYAGFDANWK